MPPAATERAITVAWLVRFRWAMLALGTTVALTASQLHVVIPWPILVVVAASVAVTNLVASRAAERAWLPAALIAVDGVALTAALATVGGIDNPFVLAYLALVALGSTLFGRRGGAAAAVGAVGALAILALVGQPVHVDHDHDHAHHQSAHDHATAHDAEHPHPHQHGSGTLDERDHLRRHTEGSWAAFVVSALLVAYLIDRALRQRERRVEELIAAARRSERLAELGALAAQAAHELGSPLATMAVAARELERGIEGDLSEEASTIRTQVERCRAILDELGRGARGEAAPAESFDVGALLAEAARLVPGVTLEVDVDPPQLTGFGPRQAIVHVVRGLVDNAHRASPEGGSIVLRGRALGDRICVEVIDHGGRIGEALRDTIGEAPVAEAEGLGIGLFLSRALVERVGGHLDLVDRPSGTTARLVLPTGEGLG